MARKPTIKDLFKVGELSPTTGQVEFITAAPTPGVPTITVNANGDIEMVGTAKADRMAVADALAKAPNGNVLYMTGKGGADTFVLEATGKPMLITDFKISERDTILFGKSTGIKDIAQLQNNGWSDAGGYHIIVETAGVGKTEYCFGIDLATVLKAYSEGLILF